MHDPTPTPREAVAAFRLSVVGHLLAQELTRGELTNELKRLAQHRYRPPGSPTTRTYHWKTLQRWLHAARRGARRLQPTSRTKGFALALDEAQRDLLLDIRRAHPTASVELIRDEAVRNSVVEEGSLSLSTLRRLFRAHDLSRSSLNRAARRSNRRRWQAHKVGYLWHADVCHVSAPTGQGTTRSWRVHALLDDRSRYIVALEVHPTETEADLLRVLCTALLRHPAPQVFYVDNGACYRGDVLAAFAQRLELRLVHARPYDPEARGKMERLWRTMRQQCTDHIERPIDTAGQLTNLLWAWVDAYHRRPHGGLMGQRPLDVYRAGAQGVPRTATQLAAALERTDKRRVGKAATIDIDGVLYETHGHLVHKTIHLRRCGLTGKVLGATYRDQSVPLAACDPSANARRRRPTATDEPAPNKLPFHPIDGLLAKAREVTDA